jgi:hypothetical protein
MAQIRSLKVVKDSSMEQNILKNTKISLYCRSFEAKKRSKESKNTGVKYFVSVFLNETLSLSPKRAFQPFLLAIKTKPEILSVKMRGTVVIDGLYGDKKYWNLPDGDASQKIFWVVIKKMLNVISGVGKCLNVSLPKKIVLSI